MPWLPRTGEQDVPAIIPLLINLTDELDEFVAAQIRTGQYQNASEVVRAGLRALKSEEAAARGAAAE